MRITFTNDFHKTEATCIVAGGRISRHAVDRVRETLCGISDCHCSQGELGQCGPQSYTAMVVLEDLTIVERAGL